MSNISFPSGLNKEYIQQQVHQALTEDIATGDVTASLLSSSKKAKATIISHEAGIFSGQLWAEYAFILVDNTTNITWYIQDGERFQAGQILCEITGFAHSLVTAERTALNFLQLLCATASRTWQYVEKIQHTQSKILDTRKTIPLLRLAQKYAVTCGGGYNHRLGLYDAILLKENHLIAEGSLQTSLEKAKQAYAQLPIIIEVETLNELEQILPLKPTRILLDNFDITQLQQAVVLNQSLIPLEASGGINLNNIIEVAETGIDYISIGDITKNIQAIDLSLRFQ